MRFTGFITLATDIRAMGTLRTLAILTGSAVVLYSGLFALVWRGELPGGAVPGLVLVATALGTLLMFLRVRYRAAKNPQSTVESRS